MPWIWTGEEITIIVEDLATLHRIVEDRELQAKEGEWNIRTIGIQ